MAEGLLVEVDVENGVSLEKILRRARRRDVGDEATALEGDDAASPQDGHRGFPARTIDLHREVVDHRRRCQNHYGMSPPLGRSPDLSEKPSLVGLPMSPESDNARASAERPQRPHRLVILRDHEDAALRVIRLDGLRRGRQKQYWECA